ncbi:MAG: hypothetical protein HYY63_04835, partial [Elusimicrobia bacterium]|nr:hypothetical protein [Elusimicrobiota bacterium]
RRAAKSLGLDEQIEIVWGRTPREVMDQVRGKGIVRILTMDKSRWLGFEKWIDRLIELPAVLHRSIQELEFDKLFHQSA